MFNARLFARMKRGAHFINIDRRRPLRRDRRSRFAALRSGHLAGAGLDVRGPRAIAARSPAVEHAERADHPAMLRSTAPPTRDKWEAMLIENCPPLCAGQPLLNIVDRRMVLMRLIPSSFKFRHRQAPG